MFVTFIYPLALTIGLIVIVMPGGLGVREGIIYTSLIYLGIDSELSLSISIYSRFWSTLGELVIFLVTLSFEKYINIGTARYS